MSMYPPDPRGMLGVGVAKHDNRGPTYVFLYYTEPFTAESLIMTRVFCNYI